MSSVWSLGTFDHSSLPSPSAPPSKVGWVDHTREGVISLFSLSSLLFFYINQVHHNKLLAKGLIEDISFEQTTNYPATATRASQSSRLSPPLWSLTSLINKAVSKVCRPLLLLLRHGLSQSNRYSRPAQVSLSRTTTINRKATRSKLTSARRQQNTDRHVILPQDDPPLDGDGPSLPLCRSRPCLRCWKHCQHFQGRGPEL